VGPETWLAYWSRLTRTGGEEEERSSIQDLRRHAQLVVAWTLHARLYARQFSGCRWGAGAVQKIWRKILGGSGGFAEKELKFDTETHGPFVLLWVGFIRNSNVELLRPPARNSVSLSLSESQCRRLVSTPSLADPRRPSDRKLLLKRTLCACLV